MVALDSHKRGRLYLLYSALSGNRHIPFATIAEVHHPDFLGVEDLRKIYGNVQDEGLFTRSLLTSAMADQDN
jgi:hypothetical protein